MIRSAVSTCRSSRWVYPPLLRCVFYSTSASMSRLCPKAEPLTQTIHKIETCTLNHLKQKTDWVSDNKNDERQIPADLEVLSTILNIMCTDEGFLQIKEPFVQVVECLRVHAKRRTDIIKLNKDRLENGALIRAFYYHSDCTLIISSIDALKEHKIIDPNRLVTEAYFSAQLRRLIRNIARVAASVGTNNYSAIISLQGAVRVFPNRDKSILKQLEDYEPAENFLATQKFNPLNSIQKIIMNLSDFFQFREKIPPEIKLWAQSNSFGLTFEELQVKYENQGMTKEQALQKIIEKSNQPNSEITGQGDEKCTEVYDDYIDDLNTAYPQIINILENQRRSRGSNTALFKIHKRHVHSLASSEHILENILENKVLKGTVVWQKLNISVLKANLGNGITAYLFPGAEEQNTSIRVTDGVHTVCREIAEFWLTNWSVG